MAIQSFRDKTTEAVFEGRCPKGFPADLFKVARRRLAYLDAAIELRVLAVPPGNRLEALLGGRQGQHSIRSTISFASAFAGANRGHWTSKSSITTESFR